MGRDPKEVVHGDSVFLAPSDEQSYQDAKNNEVHPATYEALERERKQAVNTAKLVGQFHLLLAKMNVWVEFHYYYEFVKTFGWPSKQASLEEKQFYGDMGALMRIPSQFDINTKEIRKLLLKQYALFCGTLELWRESELLAQSANITFRANNAASHAVESLSDCPMELMIRVKNDHKEWWDLAVKRSPGKPEDLTEEIQTQWGKIDKDSPIEVAKPTATNEEEDSPEVKAQQIEVFKDVAEYHERLHEELAMNRIHRVGYNIPAKRAIKEGTIRPDYYIRGGVECKDVINAWNLSYNVGTAIAYLMRAGYKPGCSTVDDLRKAITFLTFELEKLNHVERTGNTAHQTEPHILHGGDSQRPNG